MPFLSASKRTGFQAPADPTNPMIAVRTALRKLTSNGPLKKAKAVTDKAFSDKYLFYTNVTISMVLSSTGDFLEQKYEKYIGDIDAWSPKRTVFMGISGTTVGAVCHHWYKFLDRRLPGCTLSIVLKKVLLDQIICSPAYISVFFVTMGILEEKTWPQIAEEMKLKAWKLYAAEWAVWPLAQVINFYWLPTKFRVLYDNTISLGYDVFTSHVKHKES